MGIFERFFKGATNFNRQRPDILFGRYTDSYKPEEKYDAWDQAMTLFDKQQFLPAYHKLLQYLRDEEIENVRWWKEPTGIRFELLQGSKKITGYADSRKVHAEAKIAKAFNLEERFMRRLLEKNYDLQYSHFALDPDNNLTIRFDTYTLDGSPFKLYYAFKELATQADKQDDLLLDEFSGLEPVDIHHLKELPQELKVIKYDFLHRNIHFVLDYYKNGALEAAQYGGAMAYLLLDMCYKLDYLIKPEGFMMETLERINRRYFALEGTNTEIKNNNLVKELDDLVGRPKEEFYKEMYHGISTFGITTPVNHDRVISFIDGELSNMDWYFQNGHMEIAQAVPGYIIGYCLFNYALPKPDRDIFHLYYEITEAAYFEKLGFEPVLYHQGSFNKKAIKKAFRQLTEANQSKYPKFAPDISKLNFTSRAHFAKSYLLMVRDLDMSQNPV